MRSQREISELRRRRQKGNAMVEGALVMLAFMLILFGILDFGRMVWSYTLVSYGAREATRYAMVRGTDSGHAATVDDIKKIVTGSALGLDSSKITSSVSFSPDQSAGSTVRVAVTYSFSPLAPYMPGGPISLKSTSQMIIYQ